MHPHWGELGSSLLAACASPHFPWTQRSPWIPQPFPAAWLIGPCCQAGSCQDFNYVLLGVQWPMGRAGLGEGRAVYPWIAPSPDPCPDPPSLWDGTGPVTAPAGTQRHLQASPLLKFSWRKRHILLILIHGFLPDVVRSSGMGTERQGQGIAAVAGAEPAGAKHK